MKHRKHMTMTILCGLGRLVWLACQDRRQRWTPISGMRCLVRREKDCLVFEEGVGDAWLNLERLCEFS